MGLTVRCELCWRRGVLVSVVDVLLTSKRTERGGMVSTQSEDRDGLVALPPELVHLVAFRARQKKMEPRRIERRRRDACKASPLTQSQPLGYLLTTGIAPVSYAYQAYVLLLN